MSSRVFIGLGANLGQRAEQLARAIDLLGTAGVEVSRCSSLYESTPIGPVEDQPDFLNAVIEAHYPDGPAELLGRCQQVELKLGRRRRLPMGPRCIDLDLLLAEQLIIETEQLTIPHPGLTERAFVLVPLLELEPGLRDPRDGRPLSAHLERLRRIQPIKRLAPPLASVVGR